VLPLHYAPVKSGRQESNLHLSIQSRAFVCFCRGVRALLLVTGKKAPYESQQLRNFQRSAVELRAPGVEWARRESNPLPLAYLAGFVSSCRGVRGCSLSDPLMDHKAPPRAAQAKSGAALLDEKAPYKSQ
jgi:hypothetical protein